VTAEALVPLVPAEVQLPVVEECFDPVLAWLCDPRFSEKTRHAYAGDARLALAFWWEQNPGEPLNLFAVTRADVEAFLAHERARGMAVATVSRRRATLASLFARLEEDGHVDRNPCRFVRTPAPPKDGVTPELSLPDTRLLLARAASDGPKSHALVGLLAFLALRIHEACGASWEDVGASGGHRTLTVHGKGGSRVTMPIPPALWTALERLPHREGAFLRQGWKPELPLDTSSAAGIVARLGREAGIEQHVTPHQLRVGCITSLLRAGHAIEKVAVLSRHRTLSTVQVYDRRRGLDDHLAYAAGAMFAADTQDSPEP
jgi:integrase/recombinase XerD